MQRTVATVAVAIAVMASCASAFTLNNIPVARSMSLRASSICSSRASQFVAASSLRVNLPQSKRVGGMSSLKMGLFGLGWPEIAVIGVVFALIFGPSNLAGLGKDLGKLAGSVKKEAAVFSEAMNESLQESSSEMKSAINEVKAEEKAAKEKAAAKEKDEDKPVPKKKVDLTE